MTTSDSSPSETRKFISLDFEDRIICPYCNTADDEFTDYPVTLRHDGDSTETWCSHCDAKFQVLLSVTYAYATLKLEASRIPPEEQQ